ncbi:MAG: FAD-dependent oxidoreductase [Candidatus Babeliaceae bacterium]|nr:FAD-dependent oxidoreductase [Candidatus Babeliaceae bacterium]
MLKKIVFICLTLCFHVKQAAQDNYYPLIIIGGGVAGYSSAIYAGNARIPTVVFVGPRAGGQLAVAGIVENMPGVLPQYGYSIIEQLENQARTFGATLVYDTITSIAEYKQPGARFILTTQEGIEYYADAVVIATGSAPRTLGVPGESDFWGKGVSTCAICDCTLTQDRDVVIVGGGDAAIEEALQLAPYAKTITLLLRSNSFRASPRMQEKLLSFNHISYRYDVEVEEICGQDRMTGVKIYDKVTDSHEFLPAQGLFLAIGQIPQTDFIKDMVQCDKYGYISLIDRQETSVKGIFAAGDVTDNRYRQAIVASGDAAKAALDAIAFLRGIE